MGRPGVDVVSDHLDAFDGAASRRSAIIPSALNGLRQGLANIAMSLLETLITGGISEGRLGVIANAAAYKVAPDPRAYVPRVDPHASK